MSKEAMKLALEALDGIYRYGLDTLSGRSDGPDDRDWQRAGVNEMTKRARFGITALREALAEQPAQQEPVECKTLCELCVKRSYHFCANSAQTTLIPSPPAQRTWVGLTDEEMSDLQDRCGISIHQSDFQAIEAKLREKNT